METESGVPRIIEDHLTDANAGKVVWAPVKSIWFLSNALIALIGGYLFFSWSAFGVFLGFTALTLCLGHSLGMHRRLIHNSYNCPRWLEYLFVHFGVLVGMAGPIGMVHQHDLRDWAQRKRSCHSCLRHGESFFKDGWWQLNCDLQLENPPKFKPEDRIQNDAVFQFMEKNMDAAAVAMGSSFLCGRWPFVGNLGNLRAYCSVCCGALVGWLLRT